jgi:hypothetical protein
MRVHVAAKIDRRQGSRLLMRAWALRPRLILWLRESGPVFAVVAVVSLLVVLVAAIVFGGSAGSVGFALLVGCKLAAIVAMGSGRSWRLPETRADRVTLVESISVGILIAFVASLAIARFSPLSGIVLLADWLGTLALIALLCRLKQQARCVPTAVEPEVRSEFRGRTVMLKSLSGRPPLALRRSIASLEPKRVILAGDAKTVDRHQPEVVLVLDRAEPGRAKDEARATRSLLREALRHGVRSFVLVSFTPVGTKASLAERVTRTLAGLSPSRLIRVRTGGKPIDAAMANRIVRIAARGQDGGVYRLDHGTKVLDGPSGEAEALWAELDSPTASGHAR